MITIYTDGSSRGNPGPGGWAATMEFSSHKVVEIGGADAHTTNNRMELTAVLRALEYIRDHIGTATNSTTTNGTATNSTTTNGTSAVGAVTTVEINSDSAYVLNGITKWVYGWFKNNWQTADGSPVANKDIWEPMYQLVWYFKSKIELTFTKVSGHSGVLGNERADMIATAFADGDRILLFLGNKKDYERLLGDTVADRPASPEKKSKSKEQKTRSMTPAYSYVSMVGGMIETHRTWVDCEARVKGKSGAKFKKALSEAEEANIIASWTEGKIVI